jgi:hypothetical protein
VTDVPPAALLEYDVLLPVADPVLSAADQLYVIVPPSGSVEPLAEQVIVSPIVAVRGSHDTFGVVGERLVNVSVTSFELFELSVPSVAYAVTAVVPGFAREYVVLVP